jgi:hypothetical protein
METLYHSEVVLVNLFGNLFSFGGTSIIRKDPFNLTENFFHRRHYIQVCQFIHRGGPEVYYDQIGPCRFSIPGIPVGR